MTSHMNFGEFFYEGGRKMDFLQEIINFASKAVMAFGGGGAVMGILKFSEGRSQNNPGAKEEGMEKIVGGAIIFVIGMVLVPKLMTFFQ